MSVRQWGPNCYSAYVDDGSRWGRFVGVCETREAAETLAQSQKGAPTRDEMVAVSGLAGGRMRERGGDSPTAAQDPNPHDRTEDQLNTRTTRRPLPSGHGR